MAGGRDTFGNPLLKRAAHLYWLVTRGMTLGVRVLAADEQGRVCLVRHTYVSGWHLPGGGIEPGETAVDAAVRELREEAGLAALEAPALRGVFLNGGLYGRDHVMLFTLARFEVIAGARGDREIAESGFFGLDALPDGVTAGTLARLEEWRYGHPPRTTW